MGKADNIRRNKLFFRVAEYFRFIILPLCLLIFSLFSSLPDTVAAKVIRQPDGTGTRTAEPSSLPFRDGITRPTTFAAAAVVGIMLMAAARERLRFPFGCGTSRSDWVGVYPCITVMMP